MTINWHLNNGYRITILYIVLLCHNFHFSFTWYVLSAGMISLIDVIAETREVTFK